MLQTTPPGHYVLLYDGLCRFCQAGAKRLLALARPNTLHLQSFQEPGALERFPGLTHEMCMQQMILVTPRGQAIGGFEAAVQAVATRPLIGRVAYLYYLPGLRWLLDGAYALIARNRYRILGKTHGGACEGGTCALHFAAKK